MSFLENVKRDQYAEVWCALNVGEWHPSLPDRPANLDTMTRQAKQAFIWPIMSEIMTAIGIKECLREWNKERMDNAEFEARWERP